MSSFTYPGSELELFAGARGWKAYWKTFIRPYLGGEVLEVGAGIGTNTEWLADCSFRHWTCMEPDPSLARKISVQDAGRCDVIVGTLSELDHRRSFDAILYLDVLEHIEDDRAELERASAHLRARGSLIVLAPAHPFLFTPFDQAAGHWRRYTRAALRDVAPAGLREEKVVYLDSVGMLASLGNRLFLRRAMPTQAQIALWDRLMVPCSRWFDRLSFGMVGKAVLGIWRKAA
jgi:SAM-dependent methyltransferase